MTVMSIPDQRPKSSSSSKNDGGRREHASDANAESYQKQELMRRVQFQMNSNPECCDCSAPKPTWLSIIVMNDGPAQQKIGAFCCYQCAIAHRGLGTHICFVRSIGLDNITEKDAVAMEKGGNELVNAYFEAAIINLDNYDSYRPSPNEAMIDRRRYIREKYELRKYCRDAGSGRQGVGSPILPPPPSTSSSRVREPDSNTPNAMPSKPKAFRKKGSKKIAQQYHSESEIHQYSQQHHAPNIQHTAPPPTQAEKAANDAIESELQKHIDEMNKGPLIYTTNQDEVSELTEEVYSHHDMTSPRKNKSKGAISRLFSMAAKRFPSGKKGSSSGKDQQYHASPIMEGNEHITASLDERAAAVQTMLYQSDPHPNETMLPLSSSHHNPGKKQRSKSKETRILPRPNSSRKLDKYYLHDSGGGGGDEDDKNNRMIAQTTKARRRASMSNVPSKPTKTSSPESPQPKPRKIRSRCGSPHELEGTKVGTSGGSMHQRSRKPRSSRDLRVSRRSTMQHVSQPHSDENRHSKRNLATPENSSEGEEFWTDLNEQAQPEVPRRSSMGHTTVVSSANMSSTITPVAAGTSSTLTKNTLSSEDKQKLERARKRRSQKHDPLGRATFHGHATPSHRLTGSSSNGNVDVANPKNGVSDRPQVYRRSASSRDLFAREGSLQRRSAPSPSRSSRRKNEQRRATMSMLSDYERNVMNRKPSAKSKNSRSCSPSADHRWKDELACDTPSALPKRPVNGASSHSRSHHQLSLVDGSMVSPSSVGSEMYFHDGSVTAVLPSPAVASSDPSMREKLVKQGSSRKPSLTPSEQANAMSAFLDDLLGPSANALHDKNGNAIRLDEEIRQKAAEKLAELIQQTTTTAAGAPKIKTKDAEPDLTGVETGAALPSLLDPVGSMSGSPDTLNPRRRSGLVKNGKQSRSLREFLPVEKGRAAAPPNGKDGFKAKPDGPGFSAMHDDGTILSMDSDICSVETHSKVYASPPSSASRINHSSKGGSRHRGTRDSSMHSDTTADKKRAERMMILEGIAESQNLVSTPIAAKRRVKSTRSLDGGWTDDDDDAENTRQHKTSMKSLPNIPF